MESEIIPQGIIGKSKYNNATIMQIKQNIQSVNRLYSYFY